MLENITQYDNGNYTCRMKNEEIYFTKNELIIVNPLRCIANLPDSQGKCHLDCFLRILLLSYYCMTQIYFNYVIVLSHDTQNNLYVHQCLLEMSF